MNFKHLTYCFVCLSCFLVVGPAQANERGADIIERLQKKFDNIKTLSARFVRKYHWRIMDQVTEIKGRLYVERPKRFRFETQKQIVVTDGETAWNYAPENEQVLISDYNATQKDRSPEKLLFDLILLGGYAESYSPAYVGEEKVGGKSCRIVELTAKLEDTYIHSIRLWSDKRMWVVRQVEYN
ncbi:MAG: outer membrane lipoprotein carrier protein LolA, partial [Candidatus Latescibacteria bacterium]|nr:outer membrane lipoprotein carrier protein LolA [Candidatus Latescibacterota bacterium]